MIIHNYSDIQNKFLITVGGCGDIYSYDRHGSPINKTGRVDDLDEISLFLFNEFWREGYGATEVVGILEDKVYYGFYYLLDYEWLEYLHLRKDEMLKYIRGILDKEVRVEIKGNTKIYFDDRIDKDGYNLVILVDSIEAIRHFQYWNSAKDNLYRQIESMHRNR